MPSYGGAAPLSGCGHLRPRERAGVTESSRLGYKWVNDAVWTAMDSEGMDATADDVERLLADSFERSQHGRVREQLARLEGAPLITGDAARIKVAALLVAEADGPTFLTQSNSG